MRRLTILLATVAALLLVPAAQAFAAGTLTVNVEGIAGGSGEVSSVGGIAPFGGEGEPPIECSGPPSSGTCVTTMEEPEPGTHFIGLHAIAAPGSELVAWESEGDFGEPYCPYEFTEDPNDCGVLAFGENPEVTVTAYFEKALPKFPLSVAKTGTGEGTVTSSPAGIECGSECEAEFKEGTEVTLSADPEFGSAFTGWSGAGCSGTGSCVVTIEEEEEVTASFEALPEFPLEVTIEGTGEGEVSCALEAGPAEECAAEYPEGTEVALVPEAEAGSELTGWSGDCSGTGACELTIDEAKEVTATFDLIEFPLEVTIAGTGEGEVSCVLEAGPAEECEAEYPEGTEVALVPEAEAGSEFTGWSGDCSGTGPCELTMTEAKEVTATFDLEPEEFTLSVSKAGTGAGTVTSSPAGIDCGATCSASFVEETEVTLSATAAAGSTFAGWSGACTGPETCKVTMSEARSVSATFTANQTPTPPPPTPEGVGKAKVGALAKVKAAKAALKLTCSGEGPCKGTLKLTAKLEVGGKLKSLVIAKGSFSLAKGAKSTLKVKLSSPAKQAVAKAPLRARVKGTGVIASSVKLKKA